LIVFKECKNSQHGNLRFCFVAWTRGGGESRNLHDHDMLELLILWLLAVNSILLGRMALSSSSLLWKLSMAWTYGIGCERWSMFWRSYQNKTLAALVVERTEGDPLRIATTCSSVSPITMIFVISTSHYSEPQFSSILNSQLLSDWKSRCISISFRCSILF
jgi:hypothetical protein